VEDQRFSGRDDSFFLVDFSLALHALVLIIVNGSEDIKEFDYFLISKIKDVLVTRTVIPKRDARGTIIVSIPRSFRPI